MRQMFVVLSVAAAMVVGSAGAALAVEPVDRWNPGTPHAYESANCIAVASSDVTHNGLASGGTLGEGNNYPWQSGPSGGARGEEIRFLQGLCGGQAP